MSRTNRAMLVLEYLVVASPPPNHAELMRALGIPRSTLSDLLAELCALGYVEERDRRYLPGSRLLSFAQRANAVAGPRRGVRPTLERLAELTNETAVYVIRVGEQVIALEQVESPAEIRYVAVVGRPFPVHTSVAGLVCLAFSDERDDRAPADELARIRERGYGITDTEGRTTMAAPAFDSTGELAGVVCIIGPASRLAEAEERVAPVLRRELEDLRGALAAR